MRITNSIITRSSLAQIQANLRGLAEAQSQVSTGLRIQKPSDDPTAMHSVMATDGSLRALAQYRRNVQAAGSRATAEESALDQLTTLLTRAKELAISQGSDAATSTSRGAAGAEVRHLRDQMLAIGNTRFGDVYLFGGDWETSAPFDPARADLALTTPFVALDANGDPRLPTGTRRAEVSAGQFLTTSNDGDSVFLQTGVLQAVQQLSDALASDDSARVRAAVGGLDDALRGVQTLLGDVGARVNQLQVTSANLDALEVNLKTFRSDLSEVDLEQAMTELLSRQSAYQAAMLATSRVMGMNLADYLR